MVHANALKPAPIGYVQICLLSLALAKTEALLESRDIVEDAEVKITRPETESPSILINITCTQTGIQDKPGSVREALLRCEKARWKSRNLP